MTYEEFLKVWTEAATDDEAHKDIPEGSSAFLHALYAVMSAWNAPQDDGDE